MKKQIIILESPNCDDRPVDTPIDTIVLHYTGMDTAQDALERLSDTSPEARDRGRVSAHYVVDEDGSVYAMVDERDRAWHAGQSFWRGRRNLNDNSIGIEMVNPGHGEQYRPFARAQLDAVIELCKSICKRHPIVHDQILAHSDVAPGRKIDPGEKFNWRYLARNGVGVWPEPQPDDYPRAQRYLSSPTALRAALLTYGYDPDVSTEVLCSAFNRRFAKNDAPMLTWENAASLSWLNSQILKKDA